MNEARASYYLDTSALLPYYREEEISPAIQDFLLSLRFPVCISDLTAVEFASALSRWVPITTKHYIQAQKWISSRKTALRTLDALHLACCLMAEVEMVTCDEVLSYSADALGVACRLIGNGKTK